MYVLCSLGCAHIKKHTPYVHLQDSAGRGRYRCILKRRYNYTLKTQSISIDGRYMCTLKR